MSDLCLTLFCKTPLLKVRSLFSLLHLRLDRIPSMESTVSLYALNNVFLDPFFWNRSTDAHSMAE